MTLIYILIGIVLLMAAFGGYVGVYVYSDDFKPHPVQERVAGFFMYLFSSAMVAFAVFVIAFAIGNIVEQKVKAVTYSHKLASLKDGTGIEGRYSGSLFVRRGYVNDTQHFAYYRVLAPNQYVLGKRSATQSTIHTDATPETARVTITDHVYTCEPTWYTAWCTPQPAVFVHAHFHVPAGSIEQSYELDAE